MNDHIPDHERLRADLVKVFGEAPEPSPQLRARVLEHARRSRVRRAPRPRWRVPVAAATLAAAALVAVLLTGPDAPSPVQERAGQAAREQPGRVSARAPRAMTDGDLNGDGRVDILDAWRLAHAVGPKGSRQGSADLDAEGATSPDDLERLMQQIVSLSGGAS